MTEEERIEIEDLPEEYRPMSAWGYWGLGILYSIPILGQICLIIHALSGANINRRSYARSYFCTFFVCVIIVVLCGGFSKISEILQELLKTIGG